MKKLQKANEYIQQNKEKVTNRPLFHFSPEIGWMNDPNGFCFYQGEYHLFYQYYPYDIVWNDMHWGHATTQDFVHWNYKPVAMANDKVYDANGCFSGSAIEKDGKLYLMYTGHIDPNLGFDKDESQIIERQCIATSDDGIQFEKYENNPVIGEKELPEGYLICDFRDPKVTEVNGVYYCVLSVRNKKRRGEIIMFKSNDLLDWEFHSSIYQSRCEDNLLLECPDLFRIGNKDVLLFSIMPCDPEFQEEVNNRTAYVIGEMDYETGIFKAENDGLLDYGHTFYAPQSTEGKNGELLLIGWMHRWHQTSPPKEYGFNGMMSLPRRLSIEDYKLIQQPAVEINQYFNPSIIHEEVHLKKDEQIELKGKQTGYLCLNASPSNTNSFTVEVNKSGTKSTRFDIDLADSTILIVSDYGNRDRLNIADCFDVNEDITLEFFIDLHSIELFINSGKKVISFTAYDQDKGKDISVHGQGELKQVIYGEFSKVNS